jgi:hypothetical protein
MKIKFKLIDVLHDNAINGKDAMLSQLFVTPCIEYNSVFHTNLIDDKVRLESKEISPLRLFCEDFISSSFCGYEIRKIVDGMR